MLLTALVVIAAVNIDSKLDIKMQVHLKYSVFLV